MKHSRFNLFVFALLAALLAASLCVLPAYGDNLYGSIRGTVTDPSGAALSGAAVIATNIDTGIQTKVTTGQTGSYVFPQLAIGNYKVSVTATSFKAYQAAGIHLDLNQVYALDVKLELGTINEQVMVEANSTQVETTSMQLGTVVTGSTIVDMPLNGRNWTQLQQLEPGVVSSSDRFLTYSTNGSTTQQNAYLINGTDTNDSSLNSPLVIPSPDSIGEFNMVTSTINPEYGRNSGAIINAAIKNGTNSFHGDAFEFYRDTFLDAKSWFKTKASPFHQNEYGGTIGGPIVKDHAFFFFSYQGLHERIPQAASTPIVYSQAQRGGDFSSNAAGFNGVPGGNTSTGGPINPNVSPVAMFGDSASTCPVTGGVMCQAGTSYGKFYTPTNGFLGNGLFSTGVVPSQDLNPLSLKLMNQFVPLPNAGGNQFLFNPITTETYNQYIYRLDEKLREQDSIWFYGLYQSTPSQDTLPFTGSTLPGLPELAKRHYQEYTTSWNHTFSPTTLNEARFAYLRFNFAAVEPVNPINPTTYGFTGIIPQTYQSASLPLMTVGGLFTLGFSNNGPQPRIQNTYQVTDNFSKVWGRHTFKAGFSMERLEINNPFFSNLSGNFTFNGGGAFSTKVQGADFLLGFPDSYSQGSGSIVRGRGREYYSYIQDQWQVRPNLTLTLGAGWDIETPWRNLFDNGLIMGAWRPGQQSTVFPTMPAGFVYPGDTGINQYGGPTVHYTDVAPRIGFAWSPGASHKWSIRGGAGLYYNRSEEELALQTLLNAPFALGTTGGTADGSPEFATPFVGYEASNPGKFNPHPQLFPFTPPRVGSSFDASAFAPIGLNFTTLDPRTTTPRATNFNLTVQRQISPSTIVSVGYVGSLGRHEEGAINGNQAGQAPGVNPVAGAAGCPSGLFLAFASFGCPQTPITENANFTWTNGAPVAGATPYNLGIYGQPGIEATNWTSNYHSLQAEFKRSFSNGLQVLASYTWSRFFDETSNFESSSFNFPGINPFSAASMYAPSVNDAPQRLVVSYVYTLPFYKLTHHWRRLTDEWNISGIYTLQHGFPVPTFNLFSSSLTCDVNGLSFFACPDKMNIGGKLNRVSPRAYQGAGNGQPQSAGNFWFTNGPSVFLTPAAGSGIGNASRNPFYGPGINYSDMAIEKNIHIDETRYIQLRFETFNTFNHANFANPATPGFTNEDASILDQATFGQIFGVKTLTTQGDGRVVQLGAKFYF